MLTYEHSLKYHDLVHSTMIISDDEVRLTEIILYRKPSRNERITANYHKC